MENNAIFSYLMLEPRVQNQDSATATTAASECLLGVAHNANYTINFPRESIH